jgi:mono/diheme cytochrome c family protein
MRKQGRGVALLAAIALGGSACSDDADQAFYEAGVSEGLAPDQWRGRELYQRYCVGCHGESGNGKGPGAWFLDPKPRDFTRGVFKFRSTPSGSLPTDADLMRTLREGVHGTSMPSWRALPESELVALIAWLKTFSPRFQKAVPKPSISLPGAPDDVRDAERVTRGRQVYAELQCGACHGATGKGDGPSAKTLVDSEGNPIVPFDFTRRTPKGGDRPEDLYRTFMTGLTGTPMPDYADATRDELQRWDLVAFVLSLREQGRASGAAAAAEGSR